ncbi:thioesterase II family protein [Nocardia arthritidis]|uniref:Thioesterase TesA n=1 Tax=Nocardia arthritidis TaxID=228602 RepID=A0A6G9YA52_9NOCA|nr:alpha/beta fold hydrolase [Nocardia arthritidis]QIS10000.1 alpha/beta fold hydrolase [Nocardia arthritidis]
MAANAWITVFHAKPAAAYRVVYFPHAGGTAGTALPLSAAAPPSVEVVAIEYPGRQWRRSEPPATDIRQLAHGAARALLELGDRPTVLFGHSMGAIVGFEVARMLAAEGSDVVGRLFASSSGPPSRPRRRAPDAGMSDAELVAEMRELGGTDETLFADREALQLMLPALRDDYRAMASYICPPGEIDAPVTVLFGRDDPSISYRSALEWRWHTRGSVEVQTFPGGHFYLNRCTRDVIETILAHFELLASAGKQELS